MTTDLSDRECESQSPAALARHSVPLASRDLARSRVRTQPYTYPLVLSFLRFHRRRSRVEALLRARSSAFVCARPRFEKPSICRQMDVFTDDEITPLVDRVLCRSWAASSALGDGCRSHGARQTRRRPVQGAQFVRSPSQISDGRDVAFLVTEYSYLAPFVACGRGVHRRYLGIPRRRRRPTLVNGEYFSCTKKGGWQTMMCFLVTGAALSASAGWAGMKRCHANQRQDDGSRALGLEPSASNRVRRWCRHGLLRRRVRYPRL